MRALQETKQTVASAEPPKKHASAVVPPWESAGSAISFGAIRGDPTHASRGTLTVPKETSPKTKTKHHLTCAAPRPRPWRPRRVKPLKARLPGPRAPALLGSASAPATKTDASGCKKKPAFLEEPEGGLTSKRRQSRQ